MPHPSFVHPALLQEPTGDPGQVRCLTCERRCVLADGQAGWCGTRENHAGTLYTVTYGAVSSLSYNPIEKKPLYHFYPGSVALTVGSWSCNLACPWCQNWDISKQMPTDGNFMTPEDFVTRAREFGCQGTSISFNEPTLSLEWSLEVFPLARQAGLYNTFVTNGYMTQTALELLAEAGLDGMNVDVKGDTKVIQQYCQADVEVVWRNCHRARELGVWIEVTTLVIPGVNDDAECLEGIAQRIADELGPETPWHLNRYYPAYRFTAPPTPAATLEQARKMGLRAGLRYVYIGNVPGHPDENTCCPQCGALLLKRALLQLLHCAVTPDGRCAQCGYQIAGIGWDWKQHNSIALANHAAYATYQWALAA